MLWGRFFRDWIRQHFPARRKKQRKKSSERSEKDRLGREGEKLAARFLKRLGYKILEKNLAFDDGELDIIAKHENRLIVVEVKTRRPCFDLHASLAVNTSKQKKIKQLAFRYIQNQKLDLPVRFDVVSVHWPKNQEPQIEHFIDAFR